MIKINSITCKNFLSVGAVTQSVKFNNPLTLILGSNLDLGGDSAGSKNGTGKTSILNALSYGLYNHALASIRKENLINTINGKHMLVTVEFEKNGITYRIERGRKPNILKFYVNNQLQKMADDDESQGDSRETQKDIERLIGMSHTMFKHLVALNTYTEPFLSMRVADQREVIEQLLGVTLLSEKAEILKVQAKTIRDNIVEEQFRIEGIKTANDNVGKSITSLEMKSKLWNTKKDDDLSKMSLAIDKLENLDIELEIVSHNELAKWNTRDTLLTDLTEKKASREKSIIKAEKTLKKCTEAAESLKQHRCPTCSQDLHDEKHGELIINAVNEVAEANTYLDNLKVDLADCITSITNVGVLPKKPVLFYDSLTAALEHKNHLGNLHKNVMTRFEEDNPYDEQITELKKSAIQAINWDKINDLVKLKDHQEFLLKLLTNKDSFIRKKIIDQNLSYLNTRLGYYTDKMGLPHIVTFQNDLSVTIMQLGQDLDYHNLSRGEMNRLILSLSLSFRDVWESLYDSINLLFIDEILDSGLDSAGVEAGLSLLKKLARDRNKNVYLISHREELVGRVDNILKVTKENGFTAFGNSDE